jgi:N-acetylglucosaminyl-diphospho-decaprenol L-rhamnosyltransferase
MTDEVAGRADLPGRSEPAVIVVVVNHNSGDEIIRCVRSVFDSAGDAGVEVVISDNDSRDGSAQAAVAAEPRSRLIANGANLGFAAAVNVGIRASSARYVFLLNPDAEITAGTFADLVKVADDRPKAGAIGILTRSRDGTVYPSARKVPSLVEAVGHAFLDPFAPNNRFTRAYRLDDWDRQSERAVDWVSGSSMLLRRSALDEVGLLDEGYWMYVEDLDICTRLRRGGWQVLFSPVMEATHRVGSVTAGKKRYTLLHSKSVYRYFVKFRSPGWKAALRPFAWIALRLRAAVVSWRRHEV